MKNSNFGISGQIRRGMLIGIQYAIHLQDTCEPNQKMGDVIEQASKHLADKIESEMMRTHDVSELADLYELARRAHRVGEGEADMTPILFGKYIATQAMGAGLDLAGAFGESVARLVNVPISGMRFHTEGFEVKAGSFE